jgi:hypothetical protein
MQKARRHTLPGSIQERMLRPLVGVWFQVLFHSPHRGSFHLSLTVLVRYRSSKYLALEDGPPSFKPRFTCVVLLRYVIGRSVSFRLRDAYPLWYEVPLVSTNS